MRSTEPVRDQYDEAIAYLCAHPDEIGIAWHCGNPDNGQHPAACLFQMATRTGRRSGWIGCLTMIRARPERFCADGSPDLTMEIRNDQRIPISVEKSTFIRLSPVERHVFLLPFAEWQRRFDAELPRH